jgi:CMP/dCMP kinase
MESPFHPPLPARRENDRRPEDTVKVITISKTYGSGGTEFGRRLADRMGFGFVDAAYMKSVENDLQSCSPLLCSIEKEIGLGFFERLAGLKNNKNFYKTTLAALTYELAVQKDIVIVAASAHLILSKSSSLISLQVLRKLSSRVKIVAQDRGLKVDQALKIVEAKDKEKARFVRDYFDKDLLDPLLFHLTINASYVPLDDALDLVAENSERYFAKIDPVAAEKHLKDRLLEKKAQIVFHHLDMAHGSAVEFEADGADLTVRGVVGGDHERKRLLESLGSMAEVTNVIDHVKVEVLSRNIY